MCEKITIIGLSLFSNKKAEQEAILASAFSSKSSYHQYQIL